MGGAINAQHRAGHMAFPLSKTDQPYAMKQTGLIIFALVLFGWLLTAQAAPPTDKTTLHVVGIVAEIDTTHIVVKTPRGPLVSLQLAKQTQFKNKHNPQSNEPPSVEDRVIIQATKDKKTLTADVIHYSPMGQAPKPPQ